MKKTIGALMVAVSAIAMSANAEALEYTPYAGVDYTYSDFSHKGENFNGGKVFAGAQYNENFGTEVFYQRTLNAHQSNGADAARTSYHFDAFGIDALGYLPLGCEQKVALIGTAGVARYRLADRTPHEGHGHEWSWGYRLGAGAEYNVNEKVAVRALARYVDLGNFDGAAGDMWEYSLGAKYNF